MVVVDLGELDDPEERERYLEFLAENDITFARTGNGDGFVADVVLVGQGDDPQQQQPPQTSLPVFEDASTPTSRSSARASVHKFRKPFKKGPRPPNETERMLRAVSRQQDEQRRRQERDFASHDQRQHQVRHRTSSGFNASDYSSYGAFCSLIETKHNRIAPRSRTIKWTLGLVNELYDERSRLLALASSNAEYASDVSPRHAQSFGGDPELLRIFPVFVMDHLGKRYGLRRIIDQVGWDLVFNIHSARRNSLPVEMFARFLEEYYDEADVGFFLTIRAAVDQVVQQYHGSKRHHRSGSVGSTTSSAPPPPVMLRWNEVLTVAKAAYYAGSPHCADSSWQEHYRNLIDLAEEHCAVGDSSTGTGEGEGTVALLMEADELLHLAVAQFHDSRSQNQDAQVDRILEGEQKRRVLDHVLQEAQNAYRDKLRELGFAEKRAQGQLRRDMAYEQRLDEMCRAIKASAASRASKGNELELTDQKVRNWAMQLLGTEIQDGPREEDPDSEQMPSFRSTNKDNKGQDARALDETPIEHPPFVLPPSDIFERNRKTGSNRRPTSSSPPISPVAAPPPAPPPPLSSLAPPPPPPPAPASRRTEPQMNRGYGANLDRFRRARKLDDRQAETGSRAAAAAEAATEHESSKPSFTPTELVMNEIRHNMDRCKDKYVESLMVAADHGLPPTVIIEIEKEVRAQLDRKSREILNDVIGGKANRSGHVTYMYESMPEACSVSKLESDFRGILRTYNESQGSYIQMSRMVDEFCHALLNTTELRQEIEPLVALLVTYASARLGNPRQR